MPAIKGVVETCLYVDDLAAAEQFYQGVLGFPLQVSQPGRHLFFRCGKQMLLVFDPRESSDSDGDLPPHGCQGQGHVAFAIRPDQEAAWLARLKACGVEIEKQIDWEKGRSIYFRDPAGNSLELTTPLIWGIDSES